MLSFFFTCNAICPFIVELFCQLAKLLECFPPATVGTMDDPLVERDWRGEGGSCGEADDLRDEAADGGQNTDKKPTRKRYVGRPAS